MKNIFILSGPSGAGEDSIIDGLEKILPLERVVTTTSRAMRPGEKNGHPYYFIDKTSFEKKIAAGDFVEYARQYNDHLYGVTKKELDRVAATGKRGIWKIEYQGVATAKRLFPGIIAIFINAPLAILEERIRRRDNLSETYIRERMRYTKDWLTHTHLYDYIIENEQGKLEEAIKNVAAIIDRHYEK
ncbi:MAG: guanylate kinase [Candidatus Moranbacteria bacterium]|nr:guanylate kinase [Candidatus Moranbacteria bacterium]